MHFLTEGGNAEHSLSLSGARQVRVVHGSGGTGGVCACVRACVCVYACMRVCVCVYVLLVVVLQSGLANNNNCVQRRVVSSAFVGGSRGGYAAIRLV